MSKRIRSVNWDDEEKELFRSLLKEYETIIENRRTNSNTRRIRAKTWQEILKKFNTLNTRKRDMRQLKIQWKGMKILARKERLERLALNKEMNGAEAASSNIAVINIKDLLNGKDLLKDSDVYHSDECYRSSTPDLDESPPFGKTYIDTTQDHDYANSDINYSKIFSKEEHSRRIEMAEEEHTMKMAIYKEKLKSAILEREILEIKKMCEKEKVSFK